MATDQITILDLDPISIPTNAIFYVVVDGVDYQISYDNLVQFLQGKSDSRVASDVALTAGVNVITYEINSIAVPFSTTDYSLIISNLSGIGIEITAQDEDGFTVDALADCSINYIAKLNT